MRAFAIFFLVAMGAGASASPCDYYLGKSKSLGCEDSGYLVHFGHYYCAKFLRNQSKYTPSGEHFLGAVRECLIDSLEVESNLSCQNVKGVAVQSHVSCYLNSGFCSLPARDKRRLFFTIWSEIFDPEYAAVMGQIQRGCGS